MKTHLLKTLPVLVLLSVFLACPAWAQSAKESLEAHGFVDITDAVPDIVLDIRYATADNFTGAVVYPCARCFVQKDVAERLARVQEKLKIKGLGLKAYDCYRPFWVQEKFWELVPDERYVAKPKMENGKIVIGSRHNRGAAVDVTLVDENGQEIEMPTRVRRLHSQSQAGLYWRHRDFQEQSRSAHKSHVRRGVHRISHRVVAL